MKTHLPCTDRNRKSFYLRYIKASAKRGPNWNFFRRQQRNEKNASFPKIRQTRFNCLIGRLRKASIKICSGLHKIFQLLFSNSRSILCFKLRLWSTLGQLLQRSSYATNVTPNWCRSHAGAAYICNALEYHPKRHSAMGTPLIRAAQSKITTTKGFSTVRSKLQLFSNKCFAKTIPRGDTT